MRTVPTLVMSPSMMVTAAFSGTLYSTAVTLPNSLIGVPSISVLAPVQTVAGLVVSIRLPFRVRVYTAGALSVVISTVTSALVTGTVMVTFWPSTV